jgi:hypothetical protein
MYKEKRRMEKAIVILGALGIVALLYGLSWLIVVGLIKLIAMCFGVAFSLKAATGIWLGIVLIKLLFTKSDNSK